METKRTSRIWPTFLCISISFTYLLFTPLHLPLSLIGRQNLFCWRISGLIFQKGVKFLVFIQPWLNLKRQAPVPKYDKPIIIISNHRSHLDIFYYLSSIPNIRVLAKKKFFKIPLFGIGLRLLRLIPIKNNDYDIYRAALKTAKEVLVTVHDPVIFFPEMTRSPERQKNLSKFSLTPFQVAFETQATIIPSLVIGTDLSWPKGKFTGRFRKNNLLVFLPEVESKSFKSARALQKHVKKLMDEAFANHWNKYYL